MSRTTIASPLDAVTDALAVLAAARDNVTLTTHQTKSDTGIRVLSMLRLAAGVRKGAPLPPLVENAITSVLREEPCLSVPDFACRHLTCWQRRNPTAQQIIEVLDRARDVVPMTRMRGRVVHGSPVLMPGMPGGRVFFSVLRDPDRFRYVLVGQDGALVLSAIRFAPSVPDRATVVKFEGHLYAAESISVHYKHPDPSGHLPHEDCDLFAETCWGGPVNVDAASVAFTRCRVDDRAVITYLASMFRTYFHTGVVVAR